MATLALGEGKGEGKGKGEGEGEGHDGAIVKDENPHRSQARFAGALLAALGLGVGIGMWWSGENRKQ